MIQSFLTIGQLVLILFLIIGTGFFLGKKNFITDAGNKTLSNVVMYVVVPCMLITSFQREFDIEDLKKFAICFGLSVGIHLFSIGISFLVVRDKDKYKEKVFRFVVIFCNCGFMAYPLEQALFGNSGIFFGSAFVSAFYLFAWTIGIYMVSGDKSKLSLKKAVLNPGVMGVIIALLLYVLKISLPEILYTPMSYLAALNTPVPMLIIGYQLSKADIKGVFKEKKLWLTAALRLVVIPLIVLGLCFILKLDSMISIIIIIAASTPPATIISLFCAMLDKESSLSSSLVSVETLMSVVTMPVIIGLTNAIMNG